MLIVPLVRWLLVGTFTTINLFVGTVVDNFIKIKGELDGTALLTPEQKQWQSAMSAWSQKKELPRVPRPPNSICLRPIFDLVTGKPFDILPALHASAHHGAISPQASRSTSSRRW